MTEPPKYAAAVIEVTVKVESFDPEYHHARRTSNIQLNEQFRSDADLEQAVNALAQQILLAARR